MMTSKAEIAETLFGEIVVGVAVLAFKAWLLTLILGWLGIVALVFWKSVVVIIFLDMIFNLRIKRK